MGQEPVESIPCFAKNRYNVDRETPRISAAAKDLGMHRSNLHHLAIRLGLREKAKKRNQ
jgi:hypothetical protein